MLDDFHDLDLGDDDTARAAGSKPTARNPFGATGNSSELITDASLAEELGARFFDENARFVPEWGEWLFWEDGRWQRKPYVVSRGHVRDFLRFKAGEVRLDMLGHNGGNADRICKMLGSHQTVTAVEHMARSNWSSIAEPERFDADKRLLGTPGGTVDLRTGQLRPAARGDYITKRTAVAPAPAGSEPKAWLAFLRNVFPGLDGRGDDTIIAFIQRAAGYALTGETTEQKLLFLHGAGRNGKGVLVQTLTAMWGDYARTVASNVFTVQHGQPHPTGLAQLQGARLVSASEIQKGSTWDEEVIKSLTGGDTISARFMRQDFFEFQPQLTLLISGNSKPAFRSVGTSMRERFILVPFTQSFTDENGKRDPDLADKLKAEWPAILRWCIDGAVAWSRDGLNPPVAIREASADYLDEEDSVAGFIRDKLMPEPGYKLAAAEVYQVFRPWQERQGIKTPWTQNAMTRALGEEGNLEMKRVRPTNGGSVGTCIVGYRLKPVEPL